MDHAEGNGGDSRRRLPGVARRRADPATSIGADAGAAAPARAQAQGPAPALYPLDDAFLHWQLPAADKAYGAIDGKHMHEYVEELTAISSRYRDQGHPQFWGRIIGTSADAEERQWLPEQLQAFGLADVHIQPFDLAPQWMPQSWEVTASGGGKTLKLDRRRNRPTSRPAPTVPGSISKPSGSAPAAKPISSAAT